MLNKLKEKISNRKARIGIIGLGYVGLPLALTFVKNGLRVKGIDIDKDRIARLNKGQSYILDVTSSEIREAMKDGAFSVTTDFSYIRSLDAVIICVPTPLYKTREPDVSYIVAAVDNIKKYMKRGQLVVLESTTYPGTTEEVMLPILESEGLKEGKDFYLAFSPERVDPGNPKYDTKNTPKIIGGISKNSTEVAKLLYEQAIDTVVAVSSSKVAEMVKLLENTFRIVNIGLVNEIMLMCDKLGINVWEVIDAAKTKPYGFMPFYPGPGVGGHCIPVDPIYLSWKARMHGFEARFIDLASQVNSEMPHHVVAKATEGLNDQRKSLKCSTVLVVGVAYKKDVKDLRESPALEIIDLLVKKGAIVSYHDPYLPYLKIGGINLKSVPFDKNAFKDSDCVIIVTDHSNVDYRFIAKNSKLVVDTRNVLKDVKNKSNIVRL
ncbi:MAG: nucleotide sugar dehydrogenase [Candidatus Omnitrophica bacterium]|nr:nucleotide sugar dehydrogenase [Candidatus Omnitrophota bacterium]MDD5436935.1 nucleotide sugar dehydrogenase [Candidatus Omnitrophota bacterium]